MEDLVLLHLLIHLLYFQLLSFIFDCYECPGCKYEEMSFRILIENALRVLFVSFLVKLNFRLLLKNLVEEKC